MDETCFIHPSLYIADTEGKGRGMFARESIAADTIIENSPVIVMSGEERTLLDKTLLHDYIFEWQPDGAKMCCMAMGYLPVYNHSYKSNSEYFMDYEANTMCIKTVRAIAVDEEVTINYNSDWDDETPVWFDAK